MYAPATLRRRRARAWRVQFDNLVTDPENFGNWTAVAAPTVTSGQDDPFGGTGAFNIEDDSGSNERITQEVGFTGDSVKGASLFVREGDSPATSGSAIILTDQTATANRLFAGVSWSSGVPTVNVTTGTDLGTLAYSGGWYRLMLRTTSVTAANTHIYVIRPANPAETGDIYVFGAHVVDERTPGGYARV